MPLAQMMAFMAMDSSVNVNFNLINNTTMISRTFFLLVFICSSFCTLSLRAQEHVITSTVGGGFLGDGDLSTLHFGLGYGLKIGKFQPYADFAMFNGLGGKFTPGLLDDWLVNYAYESNAQERTPFLMYNNGWNARLGVLYTINSDEKNSIEIGGGINLMATNQVDLSSSLRLGEERIGIENAERIVIPSIERYLDPGYHFQVAYFHQLRENIAIGLNFNYQSAFDRPFGVYTFGGLNLRYQL